MKEKKRELAEYIEKVNNMLRKLDRCTSSYAFFSAISEIRKLDIEKINEDAREKYAKSLQLLLDHISYEEKEISEADYIDERERKELKEKINEQKEKINYLIRRYNLLFSKKK